MTKDAALAKQIMENYRQAALDPKTRALMDYAVTVTRRASEITDGSIEDLRAAGWEDEEILHATHIIGFFNYYTRMVDALGVEPEDFMLEDETR